MKQSRLTHSAVLAVVMAVTACSSDDDTTANLDGGVPSSTDDSGTVDSSPSGAETGTVDTGAEAAAPTPVNDCTITTAADHRADTANVVVTFDDTTLKYTPACIRIKAGQTVTFKGTFSSHPLAGGTVAASGSPKADAANPVPSVSTGDTKDVLFPNAGSYGYYCTRHYTVNMKGAVFVE